MAGYPKNNENFFHLFSTLNIFFIFNFKYFFSSFFLKRESKEVVKEERRKWKGKEKEEDKATEKEEKEKESESCVQKLE